MIKPLIVSALFAVLIFSLRANGQSVSWSPVKGPYGGQVQLLTVDQTGDVLATIFAGKVEVYRSLDGGLNWQRVLSVLSYGYESALAADSSGDVFYGDMDAGLFESTDRGTSWFKTNLSGGVSAISVISGNRICVRGKQKFSVSSDCGKTWTTSKVRTDPVDVASMA